MKPLLATSALALCATTAFAEDWSGGYVALDLSSFGGHSIISDLGVEIDTRDLEGSSVGIALGYNFQNGNLVYGAELYASPDGFNLVSPIVSSNRWENLVGIKGRVGYSLDKFMVYGTLGYAQTERHIDNGAVTGNPFNADGVSYGIGAEMKLNERTFVGLEYQRLALEIAENVVTPVAIFGRFSYEDNVDMITLRVGMRF